MKTVEKRWSKVCGGYALGKISSRLFRKFETTYNNITKKNK